MVLYRSCWVTDLLFRFAPLPLFFLVAISPFAVFFTTKQKNKLRVRDCREKKQERNERGCIDSARSVTRDTKGLFSTGTWQKKLRTFHEMEEKQRFSRRRVIWTMEPVQVF